VISVHNSSGINTLAKANSQLLHQLIQNTHKLAIDHFICLHVEGFQTELAYSRCGLTNVRYNCNKVSLHCICTAESPV